MRRTVLRAVVLSAAFVLVAGCGGSTDPATAGLPDDATVTRARRFGVVSVMSLMSAL